MFCFVLVVPLSLPGNLAVQGCGPKLSVLTYLGGQCFWRFDGTDWLTDWLMDWLIDWLTDWLIDWLTDGSELIDWPDSLMPSFSHWLGDIFIPLLTFISLLIMFLCWFIYSFLHAVIDHCIRLWIHSFIEYVYYNSVPRVTRSSNSQHVSKSLSTNKDQPEIV